MIKYGRSIRWFNDYENEIKFSIVNGFDFVQVWYLNGVIVLDKVPEPKEKVVKDLNFPIIFHALLDINEFEEHIPKILEILKYLSHKEVIIHPICRSEEINSNTIFKLAEKVSNANKIFSDEEITLFVENNSKLDPINYKVEEIDIMFSINPTVELLLDIAHIDNYEHLKDIIKIKKPKILHIADKHFDVVHEHLPIEKGDLDFNLIFNEILYDFDGKVIFEIVDDDDAIISSKKIIEKYLSK